MIEHIPLPVKTCHRAGFWIVRPSYVTLLALLALSVPTPDIAIILDRCGRTHNRILKDRHALLQLLLLIIR